jgi:mono/diheme cytochrome c family protein
MRAFKTIIGSLLLVATAACGDAPPPAEETTVVPTTVVPVTAELLGEGRKAYRKYCVQCHGFSGTGNGSSAAHLDPKPRDFRLGLLKFASVAAGKSPHDADYVRIITKGLAGTAMPSFRFMPLREQQAIVAYLRTFRTEPDTSGPGAIVSVPKDPYRKKPQYAGPAGEALYHGLAQCTSCHPAYVTREKTLEHRKKFDIPGDSFRDDMYQAVAKDSDWGAPITPPDFLTQRIKTGSSKEEIALVIATGVTGTAMPTWGATLKPKQLWALSYYIESLAAMRGTPEARAMMASLLDAEAAQ